MSTQQKLIKKLNLDLKDYVEQYFNSIDRFENQYILNSKITKDSPFENKPFCSEFTIFNLKEISLTDIIMGDLNKFEVQGNFKIATSSLLPKKGKELDLWTYSIFGIKIKAEASFNPEFMSIDISKIEVISN